MALKTFLIALCMAALLLAACAREPGGPTAPETPPSPAEEAPAGGGRLAAPTECAPESRQGDVCIDLYAPVCGEKADGGRETYGNSCVACHDAAVIGYRDGECLESYDAV
jgi:hypothetical protein